MELWTADKKALCLCGGAPVPVRVPSQRPLAPSIISASDTDDMIPEAVHGSPGI
jgi:hypothetical protein